MQHFIVPAHKVTPHPQIKKIVITLWSVQHYGITKNASDTHMHFMMFHPFSGICNKYPPVSLNKPLNQQFSCQWIESLCHCKVTSYDIMILLQNIYFLLFCISFHLNTHTLQNLRFRFQSVFSSTSTVVVFSSLFGHSCSVIWCVGVSDEWTTGVRSVDLLPGWAAARSPPDTWYFLVQPLACPIRTPSDCG